MTGDKPRRPARAGTDPPERELAAPAGSAGSAGPRGQRHTKGQVTMTSVQPLHETIQPATTGHLRLLRVNGVDLDLDGHRVFADGRELVLARKEYDLLRVLIENAGRVVSRRELLDTVWRPGYEDHNKTLEVHIRRLRHKLGPGTANSRVRTVRGFGYVFDVEASRLTGAE